MKTSIFKKTIALFAIFSFILLIASCGEDEPTGGGQETISLKADFTYPSGNLYSETSILFTNTSEDALSYEWDFGDGNTSTEKSPSNTYSTDGNYEVLLRAINGTEQKEKKVNITIMKKPPNITADFSVNNQTLSTRCDIAFTNQSLGGDTYTWDFGDGSTSSDENPSHIYTSAGEYVVSLKVFSGSEFMEKTSTIAVEELSTHTRYMPGDGWEKARAGFKSDDGNLIVISTTSINQNENRIKWRKVDNNGTEISNQIFGGPGRELATSAVQGDNGEVYIGHSTQSFGTSWDLGITKVDANGIKQWSNGFPENNNAEEGVRGIIRTNDGNLVVIGYTDSNTAGGIDGYAIKADQEGNKLWEFKKGTSDTDIFNGGHPTSDGGCLLLGWTTGIGAGSSDYWMVKLDASGNIQWEKTYGNTGWDSSSGDIVDTDDGGYIVSGTSWASGSSDGKILLYKVDENGNVLWQKEVNKDNKSQDVEDIIKVEDGYLLCGSDRRGEGSETTEAYIVKIDDNGNIIWDKSIGDSYHDRLYMCIEEDCAFSFVGFSDASNGSNPDVYLVKTDKEGNF